MMIRSIAWSDWRNYISEGSLTDQEFAEMKAPDNPGVTGYCAGASLGDRSDAYEVSEGLRRGRGTEWRGFELAYRRGDGSGAASISSAAGGRLATCLPRRQGLPSTHGNP